ncbi:MAG: helix-turn-helix domain-containing protein [Bacilli bacterium]|nr:helix-turn-helix domain-containing protein [Bacilli bacterium]
MKEIGERLKEARLSMGISIEEASEDLKLRPSQLENIEAGNQDAFKDIFYLKYFIRDYAKYLGLDPDEVLEDFNEYLFDYTSKISLDDIKKASKELEKKEKEEKKDKIISPYTIERKPKRHIPSGVIYGLIIILVCIIIYCVVLLCTSSDKDEPKNSINSKNEVSYVGD